MPGKSVDLQINNHQSTEEDEEELSFSGSGTLYRKKGKIYLVYEEKSEGIQGAKTTIKIDPEQKRVFLTRKGPGSINQEFIEGKVHHDSYNTAQGSLNLKTETREISIEITREAGRIEIEYDLYLGGGFFASNSLKITYKS